MEMKSAMVFDGTFKALFDESDDCSEDSDVGEGFMEKFEDILKKSNLLPTTPHKKTEHKTTSTSGQITVLEGIQKDTGALHTRTAMNYEMEEASDIKEASKGFQHNLPFAKLVRLSLASFQSKGLELIERNEIKAVEVKAIHPDATEEAQTCFVPGDLIVAVNKVTGASFPSADVLVQMLSQCPKTGEKLEVILLRGISPPDQEKLSSSQQKEVLEIGHTIGNSFECQNGAQKVDCKELEDFSIASKRKRKTSTATCIKKRCTGDALNEEREIESLLAPVKQSLSMILKSIKDDQKSATAKIQESEKKLKMKQHVFMNNCKEMKYELQRKDDQIQKKTEKIKELETKLQEFEKKFGENADKSEALLALLSQDEILTLNEKSLSALERNLEKTVVTVKMMKESLIIRRKVQTEALSCVVCLDKPKSVVLLPCKHLCICEECSGSPDLLECPMCREPISDCHHGIYL